MLHETVKNILYEVPNISYSIHVNYDHVIFKIRILKSLNIVFNKYRLKYTIY